MKVEGDTVTLVRRGQGTKGEKKKTLPEEAELGLSRSQEPAELLRDDHGATWDTALRTMTWLVPLP